MVELSWSGVCARRLARQHLAEPAPAGTDPADVVADMCGAHAQLMSAAEVSVALRTGGTAAGVRDALWSARTLVKTYGPRGTVHLLPARDLGMWTGALGALPEHSPFPPDIALTAGQTTTVLAAIDDALADAELTVDELTDAVVERAGAWAGDRVMPAFNDRWPRWRQALGDAARRGVLCFGPNRGRNVTYTSPRRWLPDFTPAPGEPALAALTRAYLRAYGPATPGQYAQWLAVPKSFVERLFTRLGDAVQPVLLGGATGYVNAGDADFSPPIDRSLRLLPHFDAYGVGCHPRELLFPGVARERALGGGQAGTIPVLLLGGVVAGVWHQRKSGRRLAVTVEPFAALSAAQRRQLDARVERLGEILDCRPELTVGPVTVGHHA